MKEWLKKEMIQSNPQISVILPTYNESQNIIEILKLIHENLTKGINTETIVVDDNSPDGTGKIVEDYVSNIKTGESLGIILLKLRINL